LKPQDSKAAGPSSAIAQYKEGVAYRLSGEERKAVPVLAQAIDQGFRTTAAWMHLIEAAFASRQSAVGVERAQEWMASRSAPPKLLLRLGKLLFNSLFYRDAREAFTSALAGLPEDREARFFLALTNHLLNEPGRAIDVLQPLMRATPPGEVVALFGSAQAQAGRYDEAAATLRSGNDSPHALLNLALILLEQDRLHDASAVLGRLEELAGGVNAKVFFHVNRNSCDVISSEVKQAAGSGSGQNSAYIISLAEQLASGYHYAAAVQLLRIALRESGATPALLYAAGSACFNLSPNSSAPADLLMQAAAADEANPAAWHLLGRLHFRQGAFSQAAEAFERAARLRSRSDYLASLGRAYLALGDEHAAAAQQVFEKALALDDRDAQTHYYSARAYSALGQADAARIHLLRAVDLEPDFYEAYYLLGLTCAKLGQREQSAQYLRRFEQYRTILKRQSVIDNGYLGEGRER
jgi:tetratricopeptide (TPR) repeat protein